ncbi:hypothetical protein TNCV_2355851 [Trichonephila clavipes]|nr:hypothetical protein TNCV_2355851 [Trichonephila clavipes]
MRFGAVKPSLLTLVTSLQFRPRSAALFPPASPCGGSEFRYRSFFLSFLRDSGCKRFISLVPVSSNFRFVFGKKKKKRRRGLVFYLEDPGVLDRDADDDSWTRIRENALRTVPR